MEAEKRITRGKPAEYDQEIVRRRYRLTNTRISFENKRILDFGCGNGAQTSQFANLNCTIDALDVDYKKIAVLNKYISSNHITNITSHLYDGRRIPFPSSYFDVVLSYEVLEHVEDESLALREIYRTLKDDGEFIISVPNKGWVFETHGAHLPLLPWHRVPFFSWLPYSIHDRFAKARIYRKRDIVRLLSDHSFIVNSADYITAPLDAVKIKRLKELLRRIIFRYDITNFSILSTAILIHCRKGDEG